MSMLSDQCDKLRKLACKYSDTNFTGAMLREAADTIWELRNVGAENAKLRELVTDLLNGQVEYALKYGLTPFNMDEWDEHMKERLRKLGIEAW